jgi:DNA topoisomerase VI subunit B
MPQTVLQRTTFETARASEYFNVRELQAQTGQPRERFAAVALKELVDNAIDAAESVGIAPVISIELTGEDGRLGIAVADNGPGIPPETVRRILNFQTRTSDKAAYRSPSRGAQGNALKTVLGLPWALGLRAPILIEAQGVMHHILAWVDPAGELRLDHEHATIPAKPGTRVSLVLPDEGQILSPHWWGQGFALFNPHASVKIRSLRPGTQHAQRGGGAQTDFYQATVSFPDPWRKFLPRDATSAWWYEAVDLKRLVFSHIAEARRGGKDLLLRDFVKQFRNLSANSKARAVCSHFPTITHLTDFEDHEDAVAVLLEVMRREAKAPSPDILGSVGEVHFRASFEAWYGLKRFWYRRLAGEVNGIPFICEAALAETIQEGSLFTGVNFSPTFEDPLANTLLPCPEFSAYGVKGFLHDAHASPIAGPWDESPVRTAAAVHLVCPALEFLDRGKTRLKVPATMAEQIAKALWHVVKDLYREAQRRRKDAARAERAAREREREAPQAPTWSLKAAVFEVLPEALAYATGNGEYPVSSRNLYYQVRRFMQRLTEKELDYDYFSQDLLIQYRDAHGPIAGLYYDPRGVLYEPHTGKALQLGTREVDGYEFPAWLYDKILYIEKKGLWPILEAARLAERYDMAVIAAEGYATEATRVLFAQAEQGRNYQLFVLHDADPYGYNIARTLREETRRMPGYSVEVIDLGLKLEAALAMGLAEEEFTRRIAIPEELVLTDTEREYFEGRQAGTKSWICRRIELNALTAPALVAYIEEHLAQAGVRGKVIPPHDTLAQLAQEAYRQQITRWTTSTIDELLGLDTIRDALAEALAPRFPLEEARQWIEEALARKPTLSWRDALDTKLRGLLLEVSAEATALLQAKVVERLAGQG